MPIRYCSPQRPGETDDEYDERETLARDHWRQDFIDSYYARKEARLPSPCSDSDMDAEEYEKDLEQQVRLVQQCMLIEAGLATISDFVTPPEYTRPPPGPHGKSLSELDPEERECMGLPPLPAWALNRRAEDVQQPSTDEVGATSSQKRKRLPEENSDEPPLAKKTRTRNKDTAPLVPRVTRTRSRQLLGTQAVNTPAAQQPPANKNRATSSYKRKRAAEESSHESPLAKKRKIISEVQSPPILLKPRATRARRRQRPVVQAEDVPIVQQPPADKSKKGIASSHKQKRVSEEKTDKPPLSKEKMRTTRKERQTQLTPSPPASMVSGRKSKRGFNRVSKKQTSQRVQPPPTPLMPRVTRARRCQLSGVEAQLLQLGHDDRAYAAPST